MDRLYPTNPTEWAALIAALAPLFIWVAASFSRAATYRQEQRAKEWLRLQELIPIINNRTDENGKPRYGAWQQLLAIEELASLKFTRQVVQTVAGEAFHHFDGRPRADNQALLVQRLEALMATPPDNLRSPYLRRSEHGAVIFY